MEKVVKYKCSECGCEFDDENECNRHESMHFSKECRIFMREDDKIFIDGHVDGFSFLDDEERLEAYKKVILKRPFEREIYIRFVKDYNDKKELKKAIKDIIAGAIAELKWNESRTNEYLESIRSRIAKLSKWKSSVNVMKFVEDNFKNKNANNN